MAGVTPRLLVLPALVLALSACSGVGGSTTADGSATGSSPSPSPSPSYEEVREDYVEQASEICERADAELSEIPPPATPDQFAPAVQETVRIAEEAQRDLSELSPPERDRAELEERVLDPFAALVEEGREYADRVEAAGSDQAQLLALLGERPTAEDVDLEHLRSYGLDVCADAIAQAG
jgi:hypothetical protein